MFAATEAKIEIEIFGTEGHKGRTILQSHGYSNTFERDTIETTRLDASIGEPYQIIVYNDGHDGPGIYSSWYLAWV